MSYQPPAYPSAPGSRPRPAVVTFAAVLMMIMALLGLISAILGFATTGGVVDRFRERAATTDASSSDIDTVVNVIRGFLIGIGILSVLFALVLLALTFGVQRGSNVSRILTWIACGLGVLCGCCGIFGVVGRGSGSFSGSNMDDRTTEDLNRALQDSFPGWWTGVSGALSGLELLGYIAIAVLLALPAANAFFRRTPPVPPAPPAPQWQPPPAR